jgi:type II secretory pathway component GspD/PulD (secretin)
MVAIATELDVPRRLISIEVKLIETNIGDDVRLGLTWPSQVTGKVGDASNGTSTSATTANSTSTTTNTSLAVLKDLNRGGWTWGTLGVDQLNVMLDFLEQNDNSKLISDPRITTLENHEAEIKLETVIPIPTISRFTEGASTADIQTFEDEEVGITLRVTPRINEAGKITMDVFPQVQEIIGYAGPADSQKPITTSRSVRTRITVNDGETAVLGGLVKEDAIERVQKVPVLGSIPLLGKLLFSSKSTQSSKTDLIILITPKVLP